MSGTIDPRLAVQDEPSRDNASEHPAARRLMVLSATAVMALGAAQFALAGFGGSGGSYLPHLIVGWIIVVLSILVLVAALTARVEPTYLYSAVALVVLAVVVSPLAVELTGRGLSLLSFKYVGVPRYLLGATHAFVGLIIFGTAGRLMGAGAPTR